MNMRTHKLTSLPLAGILAAAVFALDVFTPLGVAEWQLYLIPLLLAGNAGLPRATWLFAGLCTVLTGAGLFLSPPGLSLQLALVNRVLGVATFWVATCLLVRRQSAEATLLESEKRLRAIFNTEPECVKLLAADGSVLEMNPAGLRMLEADSFQQIENQCLYPFVVEEHRAAFRALNERVFRGEDGSCVFQIIGLRGGRRWLETHATPLRDEHGRVTAHLGVTLDITKRRQAEEDRQKFVMLADSSSEFIGMCDLDMKPFYVNPVGVRMIGLPDMAAACRVRVQDFFFPEDQHFIAEEFFPRVLREGRGEVEIRFRHFQTGTPLWMLYNVFSIRGTSGTPVGWATVSRDITDRKQAEAALRESEARLRLAAEAANVGLWDWGLKTNQVFFSREWKHQIGYREDEITNDFGEWQSRVHPDDLEPTLQKVRAFLANSQGRHKAEFRFRHKDGSYRWIYTHGDVLRDADGKPARMLGCHIDITERKQEEQKLAESREQLRALLARLQRAREEERIRVSRVVHDELGQLLTGLKMDVRWLERKLSEPGVPAALNPLLDRAVAASELTDTAIATVQKIAAELRPGVLDRLGLAAALQQEARLFQERSGATCSVAVTGPEPALSPEVADELFYLCREALTNVARHAHAANVEIRLTTEGEALVIEVRDDGVGLDMAVLDAPGSLGLLGMRERAALCDGEIEFQRNEPRGTRVTVRVPLAGASAAQETNP